MEQLRPPALEYATPPKKRARHDPAVWPSLRAFGTGVIVQMVLSVTDGKTTPGGPFISIHAEVIPVLLCLVILTLGANALFSGKPTRRVVVAAIMIISYLDGLGTTDFVVSYWQSRYSRGALIGF